MRRRASPVQQWVDSLPSPARSAPSSLGPIVRQQSVSLESESASVPECLVVTPSRQENSFAGRSSMTVSTPIAVPSSPAVSHSSASRLARDPSFQSDSSHCSSVESLLELRRADPEAVLLSLGFGGGAASPQDGGPLARIPRRFLQPSRLKGIAIDEFVRQQQETNESLDSTSLGYRGLTGSPYVAPSEIVQKIMQRLREHESHELETGPIELICPVPAQQQQDSRLLSVLSPDNRQFLDRPRAKSPDMRNKRMIIGQKSFAFGCDGNLIEVNNSRSPQSSQEDDEVFEFTSQSMGPATIQAPNESTSAELKRSLDNLKSNGDSTETIVPLRTSSPEKAKESSSWEAARPGDEGPRRASEGSRSSRSPEPEEGRRFSDSVLLQEPGSSEVGRRKRSLTRQARIHEAQTAPDEGIVVVGPLEEEPADEEPPAESRCTRCGRPQRAQQPEEEEEEEEEDKEEAGACCYGRASQSCWREMEKVLQKSKKLEDTVAKNSREMAEIRDMLSSVLSVRMEPGF